LKYGRQRDAAALAVAGLTSARNIHDEIEIGFATMARRDGSGCAGC
jgi:hypothetical protein